MFLLLKSLLRWQSAMLALIFTMLIVIMTSLLAITTLVSAVEAKITASVRPLSGADMIFSSSNAFTEEQETLIRSSIGGGSYTYRTSFDTNIALSWGEYRLADVDVVRGEYPLYESFRIQSLSWVNTESGRVWIDAATYWDLGSWSVEILGKSFVISAITQDALDTSFGFDEEASIVIDESLLGEDIVFAEITRVRYQIMVKSSLTPAELRTIRDRLESNEMFTDVRIQNASSGQWQTQDAISELTSLIRIVLLGSVAIAGAFFIWVLSRYSTRMRSVVALARLYGTTRLQVIWAFFAIFSPLILLATLIALALVNSIGDYVSTSWLLDTFSVTTVEILRSIVVVSLMLLVALWQTLSTLVTTAPLRLLSDVSFVPPDRSAILRAVIIWGASLTVMNTLLGESLLMAFLATIGMMAVIGIVYFAIRWLLSRVYDRAQRLRQKDFLTFEIFRRMVRPGSRAVELVASVFVLITLLTTVSVFAYHLKSALTLKNQDFSLFVTGIPNSALETTEKYTVDRWGDFYRVILARIWSINDQKLREHLAVEETPREFGREFNITDSDIDESIIAGRELSHSGEMTVEQSFAERLEIGIGDTVTFLVSGREFPIRVVGMRPAFTPGTDPFFYFRVAPDAFDSAPRIAFAAFRWGDADTLKRDLFSLAGPNIRVIDVGAIALQVTEILWQVLSAVSAFFVYILVLSVSALIAIIAAMWGFRSYRDAIVGYLGATEGTIVSMNRREMALLVLLGTLLGIAFGSVWAFTLVQLSQLLEAQWRAFAFVAALMVATAISMYSTTRIH